MIGRLKGQSVVLGFGRARKKPVFGKLDTGKADSAIVEGLNKLLQTFPVTPRMEQIAREVVQDHALKLKKYHKDRWAIKEKVKLLRDQGVISEEEFLTITRDADAIISLPLAARYCHHGRQDLVVEDFRVPGNTSFFGLLGRTSLRNRKVLELLVASGAGEQVATLALAHLWRLLVGTRWSRGLRQDWRDWRMDRPPVGSHTIGLGPESSVEERREWLPALYSGILSNFQKMRKEIAYFGPFIETCGNEAERKKLKSIVAELDREIARFPNI